MDTDQPDHSHSYAFKNEVTLAIGDLDMPNSTPTTTTTHATPSKQSSKSGGIVTPTPSPRMYGSSPDDHHSDDSASTHVPSPNNSSTSISHSHSDTITDNATLMRHSQSDDLSRVGLDNAAFEADGGPTTANATPKRPLSSFGQTGAGGVTAAVAAGHIKSDKSQVAAEAVNLELVNMPAAAKTVAAAVATSAKKEMTTVNMNDNYDEYFVPVNEHRKYMR